MIAFEADVRIARRIDEVFSYVSDPLKFPRWNFAVESVRTTSRGADAVAPTYWMERQLPSGRAVNELEVVASESPREFTIRTITGPTPFFYRYRFSADNDETVVTLEAQVELPLGAGLLPQLARRLVKGGVNDNLHQLKLILEGARPLRKAQRA